MTKSILGAIPATTTPRRSRTIPATTCAGDPPAAWRSGSREHLSTKTSRYAMFMSSSIERSLFEPSPDFGDAALYEVTTDAPKLLESQRFDRRFRALEMRSSAHAAYAFATPHQFRIVRAIMRAASTTLASWTCSSL
jgi:hypothetical protein